MISLAFLIAAFILFILAATGVPAGRYSLIGAGLACYTAYLLVRNL
jgi:hypothetical protein